MPETIRKNLDYSSGVYLESSHALKGITNPSNPIGKKAIVKRSLFLVLVFILLTITTSNTLGISAIEESHSLPAFPGAEGFGAYSVGGRGGQVIKVTNLDDDGPGSFRAAVTSAPKNYANAILEWETLAEYNARVAAGNTRPRHYPNGVWKSESTTKYLQRLENTVGHRIVVFEVSGIINLDRGLTIFIPYITIAGETSPGGILVAGAQTTVNTHDVIIRHMRFRVGSHQIANGADPETLDSFTILGQYWGQLEAYNIIIDHSSFSWGVDETFSITGGVMNTTVQWSIISEGLSRAGHPKGEHSKGLAISGKYVYPSSITVSHNYIAHNTDRNPLINSPINVDMIVDVVNNVAYNWKGGLSPSSQGKGLPKTNWVHNYAKQGAQSNSYSYEVTHAGSLVGKPLLYVFGNIGSSRLNQSEPHWNVGVSWRNILLNESWRKLTPWPVPPVTTTKMSYDYALKILEDVGATKPVRDSVDARVIADFDAGTGKIIDDIIYPDDYPTFPNPPYPTDNDNDGMADSWETQNGMDVSVDDSALDNDGDGYTNIEEYLHYLAFNAQINTTLFPTIIPSSNVSTSTCITINQLINSINEWKRDLRSIGSLVQQILQWSASCPTKTCTDGTNYGECSNTQPQYCNDGNLVNRASVCGCPSGEVRQGEICITQQFCGDGICNGLETPSTCPNDCQTSGTGSEAYWKFDEGTGLTAFDSSGFGNDGTISGATWTTGKYGNALSFNGNSKVEPVQNSPLQISGDLTVALWLKFSGSNPANRGLVTHASPGDSGSCANPDSNNALYSLQTQNANQLIYYHEYCGGTNELIDWNYVFSSGTFYHVTIVRDVSANTVDFYVNGTYQQTFNYNNDPNGGTAGALDIGNNPSSGDTGWGFIGVLDDVRIYDRALNMSEIAGLAGS